MSESRSNGSQGPQAQPQPNLSVLAQYVKDLSFENPGAQQSLRGRQTAPTINISINVHGGQIANNEVEVELKLDVRAVDGETVLFAIELAYAGLFRMTAIPQEQVPAGAHDRVPAPPVPLRATDHRRRQPEWRFPALDDRPGRLRRTLSAAPRRDAVAPGAARPAGVERR